MTAREGYRLRQLRIANEIQCTHSSYTITQKGFKKKTLAGMQQIAIN